MKAKAKDYSPLVVFIAIAVIGMINVGYHAENSETMTSEESNKFYESCIDQIILNCQNKVRMHNWSSSKELRKAVHIFSAKAAFLKNNKQKLIEKMVANNIEKRRHKINHFIGRQFIQEVQSKSK